MPGVPTSKPVNSRKIAAYVDAPVPSTVLFTVGGGQKTKTRTRDRCAKLDQPGTTRGAGHFFSRVIGVRASLCNWYRCVLAMISLRSISRRLREPLVERFAPYDAWSSIKIKGHGTTSPLLLILLCLTFALPPLSLPPLFVVRGTSRFSSCFAFRPRRHNCRSREPIVRLCRS